MVSLPTKPWHIPLSLQGWHYAFIKRNVDKDPSCCMALPRSTELDILKKTFLTSNEWRGVLQKYVTEKYLTLKSCYNQIHNKVIISLYLNTDGAHTGNGY